MTCRERLMWEYPEFVGDQFIGGCCGCPTSLRYADRPKYCPRGGFDPRTPELCRKCWARECELADDTIKNKEEEMNTEKKREALHDHCNSHVYCEGCVDDDNPNGFCRRHAITTATASVINDWYDSIFCKTADPAPEKPTEKCDSPAGEDTNVPTRATILDAAKAIVCDGRPQEYGGPEDSFGRIAELWTAYTKCDLDAHDVAMMMALLKIARTKGGKYNRDNYVDLAGYAACAGEIGGKGCVE